MAELKFHRRPAVVETPAGNTLLRAAHQAGITIKHPCGGKGVCGACTVLVRGEGVSPPTEAEIACLGAERIAEGYRLACLAQVAGDADVELP